MDFSLIILAGGKSSRMGVDKGLMLFKGIPMIEHITNHFKSKFKEIVIVSSNIKYTPYCNVLIADNFNNIGPLGGIEAGISASSFEKNIILSCDNPLVEWDLIEYIISHHVKNEIIFSLHNSTHPFPGYYHSSIRSKLINQINNGLRKLTSLEAHFDVLKLDCSTFNENYFINFNSPSDITLFYENNT